MSDLQKIQALQGSLALAADGTDIPDVVKVMMLQAAAALSHADLCCLPWMINAIENIAPVE